MRVTDLVGPTAAELLVRLPTLHARRAAAVAAGQPARAVPGGARGVGGPSAAVAPAALARHFPRAPVRKLAGLLDTLAALGPLPR